MKKPALDARLRAAAAYVRQDAVFADVGTDHAYLPLFLLAQKRVSRAVLTDINEGPLSRAREHAATSPYLSKMSFHLTNGLEGLSDSGITDVAVCGMGGELIADILSRAPFLKSPEVRLILQPMSRPAQLREYLSSEGFLILSETFVQAAGKSYVCLCAAYNGVPYSLSPFALEFGSAPDIKNEAFLSYLSTRERAIRTAIGGMRKGSGDSEGLSALLSEICRFKEENQLGDFV